MLLHSPLGHGNTKACQTGFSIPLQIPFLQETSMKTTLLPHPKQNKATRTALLYCYANPASNVFPPPPNFLKNSPSLRALQVSTPSTNPIFRMSFPSTPPFRPLTPQHLRAFLSIWSKLIINWCVIKYYYLIIIWCVDWKVWGSKRGAFLSLSYFLYIPKWYYTNV